MKHKITKRSVLFSGKHLKMELLDVERETGETFEWTVCNRVSNRMAAVVIAHDVTESKLLLISQYRPAADCYVLEFPAGLIDDGETPIEAAIREMREETGFVGKPANIPLGKAPFSPPVYSSVGLTGERVVYVKLDFDSLASCVTPNFQGSEQIVSHVVPEVQDNSIRQFIKRKVRDDGFALSARVYAYLIGEGCLIDYFI